MVHNKPKKIQKPKTYKYVSPTDPRELFIDKCSTILGSDPTKDQWRQTSIEINWSLGGISGGNCWGDRPDRHNDGEPEPEFTDLDRLLEALRPELTHIQFRYLYAAVVTMRKDSYGDYYGNESNTAKKSVDFGALYDYFLKQGWV